MFNNNVQTLSFTEYRTQTSVFKLSLDTSSLFLGNHGVFACLTPCSAPHRHQRIYFSTNYQAILSTFRFLEKSLQAARTKICDTIAVNILIKTKPSLTQFHFISFQKAWQKALLPLLFIQGCSSLLFLRKYLCSLQSKKQNKNTIDVLFREVLAMLCSFLKLFSQILQIYNRMKTWFLLTTMKWLKLNKCMH